MNEQILDLEKQVKVYSTLVLEENHIHFEQSDPNSPSKEVVLSPSIQGEIVFSQQVSVANYFLIKCGGYNLQNAECRTRLQFTTVGQWNYIHARLKTLTLTL